MSSGDTATSSPKDTNEGIEKNVKSPNIYVIRQGNYVLNYL